MRQQNRDHRAIVEVELRSLNLTQKLCQEIVGFSTNILVLITQHQVQAIQELQQRVMIIKGD